LIRRESSTCYQETNKHKEREKRYIKEREEKEWQEKEEGYLLDNSGQPRPLRQVSPYFKVTK
jgi:hypothetical protein